MHTAVKYIIFAIILLAFVLLLVPKPKYELFASELGEIMNDINNQNKTYSTILYLNSKNDTEADYLNIFNTTHPISSLNEPLIMNRCIQFVNDKNTNRGGIDQIINELYRDNKFFVSDKITFNYTNYNDIEKQLRYYFFRLYYESNTNSGQRVKQLYSPGYVLITQYPFIRTINSRTCEVYPTTLQGNPDKFLYSPKPVENVPNCLKQMQDIQDKVIRIEMYVLLPAHKPYKKIDSTMRLVGPYSYTNWEQIKCNMRRLFAYNPTKKAGVSVVNPRSFDEKCTTECLTPTGNIYKYLCGARNNTILGTTPQPYISKVLGTNKLPVDPEEGFPHDYANLYLINSEKMNLLLNMNPMKGMFKDCIEIDEIPLTFDTSASSCSSTVNLPAKPTTVQKTLAPLATSVFRIMIGNKCLAVDNNKNILVQECNTPGYTTKWMLETRPIATEQEPYYLLYVRINNTKWYLTKDILTSKPILTSTRPAMIVFKPRSDNQIRLAELLDNGRTVNWTNESNFCLTVYNNNLIFMSNCNEQNKNITFMPVIQAIPGTCGGDIDDNTYLINIKHVTDNL